MTTPAPQRRPSTHLTDDTNTTTQHSSKTDKATETDSTATRSKPSHHCITIRGAVPASGRPATANSRVDLVREGFPAESGWSTC